MSYYYNPQSFYQPSGYSLPPVYVPPTPVLNTGFGATGFPGAATGFPGAAWQTPQAGFGFQGPQHQFQAGPRLRVHYFDMKGRAEPTRLALLLAGIPFEDVRYSREQWAEVKEKMPFGQVPVLEVNGEMLAQTFAILRYVGKITNLYPNDPWLAAKVDEFLYCLDDFGQQLRPIFNPEQTNEEREVKVAKAKEEALPKHLGQIEKLIKTNGTGFAVGPTLTIADLMTYGFYCFVTGGGLTFKGFGEEVFDKYPGIKEIYQRISTHPQVAAWNARHEKKAE